MKNLVQIGALWRGKDKDGQPILTGTMNAQTRILIFPNGYKKEEKHPDYYVYLTANEKKDDAKKHEDEDLPF